MSKRSCVSNRFFGSFFILIGMIAGLLASNATAQTVVDTTQVPANLVLNPDRTLPGTGPGLGYRIIPYHDRFYYILQNQRPVDQAFYCVEKATGNNCAGFPKTLPDGDLSTPSRGISTGFMNEHHLVRIDKLYYPVSIINGPTFGNGVTATGSTVDDWGVGCYNLKTHQECGYAKLGQNPFDPSSTFGKFDIAVNGLVNIDNHGYVIDTFMNVHCVDLDTMSNCKNGSGQIIQPFELWSLPTPLPRVINGVLTISSNFAGQRVPNSTKIIFTVRYIAPNHVLYNSTLPIPPGTVNLTGTSNVPSDSKIAICIDTAGGQMNICNGWDSSEPFSHQGHLFNQSNFLGFDTSGNADSICSFSTSPPVLNLSCLSLVNGDEIAVTQHASLEAKAQQLVPGGKPLAGEAVLGTQIYLPVFYEREAFCYDWSTQTSCDPSATTAIMGTFPFPLNFAIEKDAADCLWVFGNRNELWSIDSVTQSPHCRSAVIAREIDKSCETKWFDIETQNVTARDYEALAIEVKDNTGTWVNYPLVTNQSGTMVTVNSVISLSSDPRFSNMNKLEYKIISTVPFGTTALTSQPQILTRTTPGSECADSVVKICKVAGDGVKIGQNFRFTITATKPGAAAGRPRRLSVPAGPAPGGYCNVAARELPIDTAVTITENEPDYSIADISVTGADNQLPLGGTILSDTVHIDEVGSGVTEVTFTNEKPAGYLEICKRGRVPGTYKFSVKNLNSGASYPVQNVPNRACSPAIKVEPGRIEIREVGVSNNPPTLVPQTAFSSCETLPANRFVSCDKYKKVIIVDVPAGNVSTQTIAAVRNCTRQTDPNCPLPTITIKP